MSYAELRTWATLYAQEVDFRKGQVERARSTMRRGAMTAEQFAVLRDLAKDSPAERHYAAELRRCYRETVPASVRAWQKGAHGVGEHLLARLLGATGDVRVGEPYHWEENTGSVKVDGKVPRRILVADEPFERTVAQLWAYCGHGDPARKRRRGTDQSEALAAGNPEAKTATYLVASAAVRASIRTLCADAAPSKKPTDDGDACRRCGEPMSEHARVALGLYGGVYDARRLATADRVHEAPCVRCGPSGRPAPEGSPWSKAHQHADGVRIVGKEILRDLWVAAGEGREGVRPTEKADPTGSAAAPSPAAEEAA